MREVLRKLELRVEAQAEGKTLFIDFMFSGFFQVSSGRIVVPTGLEKCSSAGGMPVGRGVGGTKILFLFKL